MQSRCHEGIVEHKFLYCQGENVAGVVVKHSAISFQGRTKRIGLFDNLGHTGLHKSPERTCILSI